MHERHCRPCARGTQPLDRAQAGALLAALHPDWTLSTDGRALSRDYGFGNYYQTMAFVNAVAWIAHSEDHHPDLEVGYKHCHVRYSTHMIGGLSENDFICAARIDALLPAAA
ncbi:MAG: 4a-hydroxytetrahydrobiopterin dehydratase [Pseudomonadota bacterium]